MKDSVKLGAAVAGGYLLGRTKKGKAAIGLALWLSGKRIGNSREALARLATSPELARLTAQVRGPLLEAAQRAVTATVEDRTTALADSLHQRTSKLIDGNVTSVVDGEPADGPDVNGPTDEPVDDVPEEPQARTDLPRQAKSRGSSARRSPAARTPAGARKPGRRRDEPRNDA